MQSLYILYLIIIVHNFRIDFYLQDLRFDEWFIVAHKSLYLTFGNSIAHNFFSWECTYQTIILSCHQFCFYSCLSVCMSVCRVLHTLVPTFMHLAPPPVPYVCLSAKLGTKGTLHPLLTLQNNEPVPQVLKQVVNLSCLLCYTGPISLTVLGLS